MRFLKKYYLVYILLLALFAGGAMLFRKNESQVQRTASIVQNSTKTVVIDPGHGGEDGGAVSQSGTKESLLNLEVGLRLNDLFRVIGIETAMTRCEDVSIYDTDATTVSEKKVSDLRNRAVLVNSIPNALFLSIHQNMFSEARYRGAQVFYAPTAESEQLAECLQTLLREKADPSNHREAKPCSDVWLMEHIECTGVLIECGFLSNAEEEQLLQTKDYQKKLVCVVAGGVIQFLSEENGNHEI